MRARSHAGSPRRGAQGPTAALVIGSRTQRRSYIGCRMSLRTRAERGSRRTDARWQRQLRRHGRVQRSIDAASTATARSSPPDDHSAAIPVHGGLRPHRLEERRIARCRGRHSDQALRLPHQVGLMVRRREDLDEYGRGGGTARRGPLGQPAQQTRRPVRPIGGQLITGQFVLRQHVIRVLPAPGAIAPGLLLLSSSRPVRQCASPLVTGSTREAPIPVPQNQFGRCRPAHK